jgi:hypothetical protein
MRSKCNNLSKPKTILTKRRFFEKQLNKVIIAISDDIFDGLLLKNRTDKFRPSFGKILWDSIFLENLSGNWNGLNICWICLIHHAKTTTSAAAVVTVKK